MKGAEKVVKPVRIEAPIEPQAAAYVETRGLHALECLARIAGIQAAGQQDRNAHALGDPPADRPVMNATRAAQLLDRERGIARIEQ